MYLLGGILALLLLYLVFFRYYQHFIQLPILKRPPAMDLPGFRAKVVTLCWVLLLTSCLLFFVVTPWLAAAPPVIFTGLLLAHNELRARKRKNIIWQCAVSYAELCRKGMSPLNATKAVVGSLVPECECWVQDEEKDDLEFVLLYCALPRLGLITPDENIKPVEEAKASQLLRHYLAAYLPGDIREEPGLTYCNHCGGSMPGTADFCPNCGKGVRGEELARAARGSQQVAPKRRVKLMPLYCPDCGYEDPARVAGVAYCQDCGTRLRAPRTVAMAEES